ncbi:hypothetical protein [Eleftheria terrae]|uniref:hypothetical protein n=1 Tax=Eleftheria terrae TaxID=1597781 RepID=UPI00263B1536|nr:hypothetical protein [Eleftheria terrae]WKB53989.1 hypothetical protein N7L95_06260 [Eleftheria terrae]
MMNKQVLFSYGGPDGAARFWAVLWLLGSAAVSWVRFKAPVASGVLASTAVLAVAGLSCAITVTPRSVEIHRSLWRLRYKTYRAERIDHVGYDGEYGTEAGALWMVVVLQGKEVYFASRRTMREVHDRLAAVIESQRVG